MRSNCHALLCLNMPSPSLSLSAGTKAEKLKKEEGMFKEKFEEAGAQSIEKIVQVKGKRDRK